MSNNIKKNYSKQHTKWNNSSTTQTSIRNDDMITRYWIKVAASWHTAQQGPRQPGNLVSTWACTTWPHWFIFVQVTQLLKLSLLWPTICAAQAMFVRLSACELCAFLSSAGPHCAPITGWLVFLGCRWVEARTRALFHSSIGLGAYQLACHPSIEVNFCKVCSSIWVEHLIFPGVYIDRRGDHSALAIPFF